MVITRTGIAVLEDYHDLVLSRWVERDQSLDAYDRRIAEIFVPMLPKGGVVIDGGAFLGSHTVAYAKAVGETGRVIAFEPLPRHVECLLHNTQMLPQVEVVPHALYSTETWLWITPNPRNAGASVVGSPDDPGALEVQATTIDSYAWERVDLIKLDVEGLVLRALEGATRTLRKHRPKVITEVGDNLALFGDSTEDVIAFMSGCGYLLKELPQMDGETNPESQRDVLFQPVEEAGAAA